MVRLLMVALFHNHVPIIQAFCAPCQHPEQQKHKAEAYLLMQNRNSYDGKVRQCRFVKHIGIHKFATSIDEDQSNQYKMKYPSPSEHSADSHSIGC